MPTPDFSKIFGTNATSTQNWSDSNYLTGWGFLGQAPPPYQLFDDYFKNTDTKLKWLYDNFSSIDVTTAINTHNLDIESHPKLNFNILKRNKAYSIGDIAYSSTLPSWVQLQCKTAGTTGASEPIWGTLVAGQEVTDGTVVWIVYDVKCDISGKVDKTTYATDFTKSFGVSGYQKLPSGLIIQWGITPNTVTPTFPVTFPTACFVVVVTDDDTTPSVSSVSAKSTTGFTVSGDNSVHYITIGY